MLDSLHIENIAIIKTLDVDLSNGFTVLTGETGAGKSIIIDSIQLLLGGKGDKELIRNGEQRALVTGTFSRVSETLKARLIEFGLLTEDSEDEPVILQRTLGSDGRSTARFCGRPITLAMLKEIGSLLMTIHGQNDNGQLLRKSTHLSLLDRYADNKDLLLEYEAVYTDLRRVISDEEEYKKKESEKARLSEILSYQIRDIDAGKLKDGEEDELFQRRNQLQYAEKIAKNTGFCYRALKGAEKGSAVTLIEKSAAALRALAGVLPDAEALAERLDICRYEIEDIAESADALGEIDCDDPTEQLNRVEERLDMIRKLERKYGETVAEILTYRKKIAEELAQIENGEDYLRELAERKESLLLRANTFANQLTAARVAAAERLEKETAEVLSFLDMPKVRFCVRVRKDTLGATGQDDVEFLISTNPSEPPAPLIKIASGGELSRIMLALCSVFSDKEGIDSLIFDEIDTGISGKTSQKVGIKLKQLAKPLQVICITHSPQIAALADNHFRITKNEVSGRNETSLTLLDDTGRIDEVARILGGINVTDAQRRSAKELIEYGETL